MITPVDINEVIAREWPDAGCSCVDVGQDRATALLVPSGSAVRPGGFISGPTLFAAADAALWYLTFGAAGRIEPLALTSDLSIRFLRPAVGTKVYAHATLDRASRRSVVGTVRVWTDDNEAEPCATAQGAYVLPRDEKT